VWGIVFQFPFYAGLMGLLKGTGLGLQMARFFADISTPTTWPTIGLLSQTFLNLFIPSGGTQWLVTSELLVETGRRLGFSDAHSILIEVMGDQLANMVTPMWALPALALARLRARDILGYTAVVMGLGAVIMALGLTLIRP
jgi:short-chain fatty acids transporter